MCGFISGFFWTILQKQYANRALVIIILIIGIYHYDTTYHYLSNNRHISLPISLSHLYCPKLTASSHFRKQLCIFKEIQHYLNLLET